MKNTVRQRSLSTACHLLASFAMLAPLHASDDSKASAIMGSATTSLGDASTPGEGGPPTRTRPEGMPSTKSIDRPHGTFNPGKVPRPAIGTVGKYALHSNSNKVSSLAPALPIPAPRRTTLATAPLTLRSHQGVFDDHQSSSIIARSRSNDSRIPSNHRASSNHSASLTQRDLPAPPVDTTSFRRVEGLDTPNAVQLAAIHTPNPRRAEKTSANTETPSSPQRKPEIVRTTSVPSTIATPKIAQPAPIPQRTLSASTNIPCGSCEDAWSDSAPSFSYYRRPYQFTDIADQQHSSQVTKVTNPYDNRFFETLYTETQIAEFR